LQSIALLYLFRRYADTAILFVMGHGRETPGQTYSVAGLTG
jgi:hypothetical protein